MLADDDCTPLSHEITNKHSLRTDGKAREEEEEVKGGDTKSQTLRKSNKVSVGKGPLPDLTVNMMM